jgi:hypothetical protein
MDRQQFLQAATRLHEYEVDSGPLDLGKVWIRELTAKQRIEAQEAARLRDSAGNVLTDDLGRPRTDEAIYRAFLIQSGVISGPGGEHVLTIEDVPTLTDQGRDCLAKLAQDIMSLSWLGASDLFRGGEPADSGQPGTEGSEGTGDSPADSEGSPPASV